MKFPQLNIPFSPLKIKEQDGIVKVYDPLRDKLVALTPEEYVRQQFTAWLHSAFNYPQSLMANEIGITVNGMKNGAIRWSSTKMARHCSLLNTKRRMLG